MYSDEIILSKYKQINWKLIMDKIMPKIYHRPRILKSITSLDDANHYALNRCIQLLKYGWKTIRFEEIKKHNDVVSIIVYLNHIKTKQDGQFIVLLDQYIGNGLYLHTYNNSERYITLTFDNCGMQSYFDKKNIKYHLYRNNSYGDYYRYITDFYGDRKSNRSDVYYMNHIDEGLGLIYLLNIEHNDIVNDIYILHPLFQGDNELKTSISNEHEWNHDDYVIRLIGVMEYRNIANQYLSYRTISSLDEINMSPIKYVNDALMIDKIQNFKDFLLYHQNIHPRSNELTRYFTNWLDKFGVSNELFEQCVSFIDSPRNIFGNISNTTYIKCDNEMNDTTPQQKLPMNLILIQGSRGSGKTTTLNNIASIGSMDIHRYKMFINDYKVSSRYYNDIQINCELGNDFQYIIDKLRCHTFQYLYIDLDFITKQTLINIANHFYNIKIFATLNSDY